MSQRPHSNALPRALACLCILAAGLAEAQPQTAAEIYSCKDARGHTITADRPIADCFDRAQRELSASGALRRTVGPATSAIEEDQRIERARRAEALQQANSEERRRDRALLARYATPQAHARERAAARVDRPAPSVRKESASAVARKTTADAPRAAAVAGIFGAALLSVPWLGLAPALGLAGGLVTLLFPGTQRPARAVATAVGLWLIAFLLFGKLLGLPLP